MLALSFVAIALSASQALAAATGFLAPPKELFSPLVKEKVLKTALQFPNPPKYPHLTDRVEGKWQWNPVDWWTTGFFPATLYAMHERTKLCRTSDVGDAAQWLELGQTWATGSIPLEVRNSVGHDVGFLSYPFLDELKIHPDNATALNSVHAYTNILAGRYNPVVGCTRSWDSSDPTDFQVIIDNMMNLEIFFVSEKLTGNHTFREMAINHADKTIENHIRPDGGSFHVVHYNSLTGNVTLQRTSQGYADNSTWSRGQAWGIYGFAMMHQQTKEYRYLQTARRMANYFISHIPSDGIVPWDFNAPLVPAPRPADSSAAMLAVNGLMLLADEEKSVWNLVGHAYYMGAALKILRDNTKLAWSPTWDSLLSNGTSNNPAGSNLTGVVYGDYYFIKAGNELLSRGLAKC
ncbi:d-4,5 unsaturated-glucuronyl hydrolase-like protein [Earliella scabrosa]|nr:d-4,5 unsaturated-glucuronyl hydrolase-like protein [Earliella scabrosa]